MWSILIGWMLLILLKKVYGTLVWMLEFFFNRDTSLSHNLHYSERVFLLYEFMTLGRHFVTWLISVMSNYRNYVFQGFGTQRTAMGFSLLWTLECCMKRRGITKILTTPWTPVWFLTCVNSSVKCERWFSSKGLLTQGATNWFLPSMNSYITLEKWWIFKGPPTKWTTEWFFACVNSNLTLQRFWLSKGLPQNEQLNGFSPVWILIWPFRDSDYLKVCSHNEKLKHFLLYDLKCLLRHDESLNFSHNEHLNGSDLCDF